MGYSNISQGVVGRGRPTRIPIAFDSGQGSQVKSQARGVVFL